MAKEVGSVVANAVLNARPFADGAAQASRSLDRFVNRSKRKAGEFSASMERGVSGSLRTVIAVAAAAAGPAALGALAKAQAAAVDSQQKFASRIGTTQARLVALHVAAAELAGVTDGTLNMAMQRMTRRTAEAAQGTGEARAAIAELGLDARELARMDPADQMRAIADALKGVAGSGDQLRLAFKLFDSEGAALVTMLREGSRALDDYQQLADDLGLSLSRIDTAKIEAANDAWGRTGLAVKGLGNSIAVELAPFVTAVSNEIVGASAKTGGFRDTVQTAVTMAARGFGFVADVVHGLRVAVTGVEVAAQAGGVAMLTVYTTVAKKIAGAIDDLIIPAINRAIDAHNATVAKITGQTMEHIGAVSTSPVIAGLEGALAGARTRLTEMQAALMAMALAPMPSEGVEAWVARVKQAAEEAAQAVASATSGAVDPPVDGAAAEKARGQLDQVLGFGRSDAEAEQAAFAERLEILQKNLELKNLTHARFESILEDQVKRHMDRMAKIEAKGHTERQKFEAKSMVQKAQTIFGELSSITAGVAQHNKAMFTANKVAGIAEAVINGYIGVSKTLSAYPFPINVGMAAAHAAVAAAQVSAIASASYQGGGGGTTPSVAGSAPVVNDVPVQRAATIDPDVFADRGQTRPQTVVIEVRGSDALTRAVADNMAAMVRESDYQLVDPRSRNAADIREALA